MALRYRVLALLVFLAGLVLAVGLWVDHAFWSHLCGTTISRELTSPDGKNVIVLFHRDCGATVAFNTQASMMRTGQEFSPDDDDPFLVIENLHDLPVRWLTNDRAEITLPRGERIYRQNPAADGITIVYR